jgi:hypothetical protein
MNICVISDRHRGIKGVFQRRHLGWSVERGEAVHRYYMQHATENLYNEAEKSGKKKKITSWMISEGDYRIIKSRRFIER